jgi:hypothetical protein
VILRPLANVSRLTWPNADLQYFLEANNKSTFSLVIRPLVRRWFHPQIQAGATTGLAAQVRHTSRVAGITAREKADTPRRRQEMIARFAVELESNA